MKIPEGHLVGIIDQKLFRNAILIENEDLKIDWKKTMEESKLTLEDLSTETGVSEGTLSNWLSGKHQALHGHRSLVVGWLLRNAHEVHLIK